MMLGELDVLKNISHPYTIEIVEILHDRKYFYIVSEECIGGELTERMKRNMSEKDAAWIVF